MAGDAILKDLLLVTRDGEWGEAEPQSDLVEMAIRRGTDFDKRNLAVELLDKLLSGVGSSVTWGPT